ncbi:hypothetical protein Tco_0052188 [Tanacetum coccineum]
MTDQDRIEQPENVQAKESIPEPQVEQPAVPHPSFSQTLSSAKYGNQFINDNPEVLLTDVLKEPEAEVQSLVDVLVLQHKLAEQRPPLVDTISRFNLPEAIDKSVQTHLKNILPKDVPDFATLDEYDQKDKLLKMTRTSKSYNKHPTHRALYDALMQSLIIDEDDMDKQLEEQSTLKKRRRDDNDQDPQADSEKEIKKKKQKDSESSRKDKDQVGSPKKGKSPSKSSKADKSVHADETVHDVEIKTIEDDVVDVEDPTQADASAPKQDKSTWFKMVVVERPESPDPE